MTDGASLATRQHPIDVPDVTFPPAPPLTTGDPRATTPAEQRPLVVDYDYTAVPADLFTRPLAPGASRWAPLLPPLAGQGLGAGATPLVRATGLDDWIDLDAPVYLKDESQNPTWSHKDRLTRLTVGAAVATDADGIVAASTGNHGAAAAAYAARNDLPCVVFTLPDTPPAMESFVRAYGATVRQVGDHDQLVPLVDAVADRGFHAVTSRTAVHTGHPYGPEGYKPIAYEIHAQLGEVPAAVAVPTGLAELIYGVWRGFRELAQLGVTTETPRMLACEPATQAALSVALERDEPVVEIDAGPSAAHSIGGATSTHRGYHALVESDGTAVAVPESTTTAAQNRLARTGRWQEVSGAVGVGGLRAIDRTFTGPVVALTCSSGFKDGTDWQAPRLAPDATPAAVVDRLADREGLPLTAAADRSGSAADEG